MQAALCSILRYIELYETTWATLHLENNSEELLKDYQNGIIQTTWMVSYEHIKQKNEAAVNILHLWAFIDCKNIWLELFQPLTNHTQSNLVLKWFEKTFLDFLSFYDSVVKLLAYSLINEDIEWDTYTVHPVVHQWSFEITSRQNQENFMWLAITSVSLTIPQKEKHADRVLEQQLLRHSYKCYRWIQENVIKIPKSRGQQELLFKAFHSIIRLFCRFEDLKKTKELYQQELSRHIKLGFKNQIILSRFLNLKNVYKYQNKLEKARDLFICAMTEYAETLKDEPAVDFDNWIYMFSQSLSNLFHKEDRLAEAEELYQWALKICGSNHWASVNIFVRLGSLYQEQGKLQEAEKMYKQGSDQGRGGFWQQWHINVESSSKSQGFVQQVKQAISDKADVSKSTHWVWGGHKTKSFIKIWDAL